MIIQILSNLFEEGYLKAEEYHLLCPFFSGDNSAFRRQALNEAGLYDTNCYSGEDQDICLKIAKAGWDLYFEPKAIIRHKNKMTLHQFLRKWYTYGFYHPYIFKKHGPEGFQIYRTNRRATKNTIYRCLFSVKFPFRISIFLTKLLAMNFCFILSIILAATGLNIAAIAGGIITIILFFLYFKSDINLKNPWQSLVFVFLRYTANLALFSGGFWGGIKRGMLYISPTLDYKK